MAEFRIYYESLEQGWDYVAPLIRDASPDAAIEIRLVKRPRSISGRVEGLIKAIYALSTPDILITGVHEGKEYPLVFIEFSEAVIAEDHELQRTNGAIAALLAEIFYLKISGEKETDKQFAGAKYNPHTTPLILSEVFKYEGYFIAKWNTVPGFPYRLQRQPQLPACPPEIALVRDTIKSAIIAFIEHGKDWYSYAILHVKGTQSYAKFLEFLEQAFNSDQLLLEWRKRERTHVIKERRDRIRYSIDESQITIKLYRFSHGMDPDRGIATFISFVYTALYKVYGVYSISRRSIRAPISSLDTWRQNFEAALKLDASSVPPWFISKLRRIALSIESLTDQVDITDFWEKNFDNIRNDKVVMTLALFLDGIFLGQGGPLLKWDRFTILKHNREDFIEALKNFWGFRAATSPLVIQQIKEIVDEDEVTYALVHRVLLPNKFRIVSVSYPGSQGDAAVLPEPEGGLSQKRNYTDVVALPPDGIRSFDVLLEESKGMFSKAQLENATSQLTKYLDSTAERDALSRMLIRAQVLDPRGTIRDLVIGVGFGVGLTSKTNWEPGRVDFIFRIAGRVRWGIGIFRQDLRDLIDPIEGDTNLPDCFRVHSRS